MIDLRSDTVTQPTQRMREAMFNAEVGDDVYGNDPTINRLEQLAAERLGKEAALFVTSGTQGNEIAVMAHTRRGDSFIMGRTSHIAEHEAGAYAVLAAVSPCYVQEIDGVLDPDSVRAAMMDDSDLQIARTGLICVENALANGNVAPVENLRRIYEIAREHHVPVHLDGARLFNAALVNKVDVKEMTRYCDSVMTCLSKGLCAPVGSILAGQKTFIDRARKTRKMLGGGMRQAGFLAAAGIVALTEMTGRLEEDHDNARYLAERLSELPAIQVAIERVKINMIFYTVDCSVEKAAQIPARMLERGIRMSGNEGGVWRMVTSHDVSRADCDYVVQSLRDILTA